MSLLAQIDSWLADHGLTERDCSKIDIDRSLFSREMLATVFLDITAFRVAFRGLEVTVDDTGSRIWYSHESGPIRFKAMGEEIGKGATRKVVLDEAVA